MAAQKVQVKAPLSGRFTCQSDFDSTATGVLFRDVEELVVSAIDDNGDPDGTNTFNVWIRLGENGVWAAFFQGARTTFRQRFFGAPVVQVQVESSATQAAYVAIAPRPKSKPCGCGGGCGGKG